MLFHVVSVNKDFFEENDRLAEENKSMLSARGAVAIDVLGSIGSGKTSIIEWLAQHTKKSVAAIAGDVAGDDDARRLQKLMPAESVSTGKECHLDAHLVKHALEHLPEAEVVFIENVGNLVCPVDFLLGASKRVVVISVTEGEDKVRKHPLIFKQADVLVVNKTDLSEAMGVDPQALVNEFRELNPDGRAFITSTRSGLGLQPLAEELGL